FCDPNFEEWMVWPIKRKGEIIGLLIINDPGEDKRDSVGVLINQSNVLFENAILYENLITTGKRLRELDHQKSKFLHMLGHDLRTPLTSIKSYCEMLLMYKDEPWETQEEFLNIIKKESERLTTLINNFLDVSRVDTNLDKLKKSTFPVAPLFDHFISFYKEESQHKCICFTKIIPPDLPDAFADKHLITHVMANLMSNAIKYTPAHGKIILEAKYQNSNSEDPKSTIEISVANTGPDIPIVYQEMIFEKFGQTENRLAKHKGGMGLGLPVARDIIERHNGKIWIESAPEKGVKFFFTLHREEK
ncbi:MAG: HAMP domain-containing sensor histidine kinase, partial [Candidatus Cloacimonadota bacterium]|nr:HAMP domain-containing sensor histidine kinase [Candidatus Cloacimonadota bacterium]